MLHFSHTKEVWTTRKVSTRSFSMQLVVSSSTTKVGAWCLVIWTQPAIRCLLWSTSIRRGSCYYFLAPFVDHTHATYVLISQHDWPLFKNWKIVFLPVRQSNVFDPGLNRKLWSGSSNVKRQETLTPVVAGLHWLCYHIPTPLIHCFLNRGRCSKKTGEESKASNRKPLQSAATNGQKTIAFKKDSTSLDGDETKHLEDKFFGDIAGCKNCESNRTLAGGKRRFCAHIDHKYPLSLNSWCPWQNTKQYFAHVGHSTKTSRFCKLMRFAGKAKGGKLDLEAYETSMKNNLHMADVVSGELLVVFITSLLVYTGFSLMK